MSKIHVLVAEDIKEALTNIHYQMVTRAHYKIEVINSLQKIKNSLDF